MLLKIESSAIVLAPNPQEKIVIAQVIAFVQANLGKLPNLPREEGGHFGPEMSRSLVQGYLEYLAENLDLGSSQSEGTTEVQIEAARRKIAVRRKDAFVNTHGVHCSYDRCGGYHMRPHGSNKHPWVEALEKGWTILHEDLNPEYTDLVCPLGHDEHGCPIPADVDRNDPQSYCELWPFGN